MKRILFLVPIVCCLSGIWAQQITRSVISPFGNSATRNNLYLSQTVGQPSGYSALNATENRVNQGFEQAFFREIIQFNFMDWSLFPNPNSGNFQVIVTASQAKTFTLKISDISGKLILSGAGLVGLSQTISLDNSLSRGSYLVHITADSGLSSSKLVILQ
jgi:hypothetical protein